MKLDDHAKKAVRELGNAINAAIEKSDRVVNAIENLREIGYEPNLLLKLEIALKEIEDEFEGFSEEFELDLTADDMETLQSMRIRIDDE